MPPISRGFGGRRRPESEPSRVPPGQYVTDDFPVLSAGPTPHTPLAEWSFTIQGALDEPRSWTWDELTSLPSESVTVDIHCVTKWSKLDTIWAGVSVDTLLDGVETSAEYVPPSATAGTRQPPTRRRHRQQGLGRVRVRRRATRPGTRRPRAASCAASLFLEEREVGARARLDTRRRAGLLGGLWLSQLRRSMARTALLRRLNWQLATVIELVDETARVRSIVVEPAAWPGHLAGQHVDVRLTAEDGYQAQRSYSIASAPEDGYLVLTVERLEDGEVSAYLVDELRPGDELELRGPVGGYFVWEESPRRSAPARRRWLGCRPADAPCCATTARSRAWFPCACCTRPARSTRSSTTKSSCASRPSTRSTFASRSPARSPKAGTDTLAESTGNCSVRLPGHRATSHSSTSVARRASSRPRRARLSISATTRADQGRTFRTDMSDGADQRSLLPALPLGDWESTKDTLHLWAQIVGKVRMASTAPRNHWWNVPLYVDVRGLTTRRMHASGGVTFQIDFDFVDQRLVVQTNLGAIESFALVDGLSVAAFDESCTRRCGGSASTSRSGRRRSACPRRHPSRPTRACRVRPRRGRALLAHPRVDRRRVRGVRRLVLRQDEPDPPLLALVRPRLHPLRRRGVPRRLPGADPVNQEAYSHEVISFGFWAGDQKVREPTYYSYTAPEPAACASSPSPRWRRLDRARRRLAGAASVRGGQDGSTTRGRRCSHSWRAPTRPAPTRPAGIGAGARVVVVSQPAAAERSPRTRMRP